jgi:hypothetical protein
MVAGPLIDWSGFVFFSKSAVHQAGNIRTCAATLQLTRRGCEIRILVGGGGFTM